MSVRPWSTRLLRLALLALAALPLGAGAAATLGGSRFAAASRRVHEVPAAVPEFPRTADVLARGRHLAQTIGGCTECHGADLGGHVMVDDGAVRIVAPNLTGGPGSATEGYTDADWFRILAYGVRPDGTSLRVMPTADLAKLADDDLAALIAWVRTQGPVDRDLGASRFGLVPRVMIGLFEPSFFSAQAVDPNAPRRRSAPVPAASVEYGAYLVAPCRGCHGPDLRGGEAPLPGAPPAADLTAASLATWSYEGFARALREGIGRDGAPLDDAMPWAATKKLTDLELRAMWLALTQPLEG